MTVIPPCCLNNVTLFVRIAYPINIANLTSGKRQAVVFEVHPVGTAQAQLVDLKAKIIPARGKPVFCIISCLGYEQACKLVVSKRLIVVQVTLIGIVGAPSVL